ncbi:FAD:protein FMN transferase [Aquimarina intermedia]|uniref:FAD:protein FMN transferase n=1 Tax=Aquimarina intermedia TaxID=350814 RepID=A0A5S5C3L2_9FLAO|nr:FAD:protein FMN transferase [Aquimarina intermedia]TYP72910.1 thiamine biosynthesis lipoprotein [Aquimarina intermedia]
MGNALKLFFYTFQFLFLSISPVKAQVVVKETFTKMGSDFEVTVVAETENEGTYFINLAIEEIERIEQLISSWNVNSQTSLINRNAGIQAVAVKKELYDLIERTIGISKITDGAFDITYASMDRIWRFDGSMHTMPSHEEIKASVAKVGYKNVILYPQNTAVFLTMTGMKVGFGAIGKGYAADKAKQVLQSKGVKAGIINASGDMNAWGKQPNGTDWKVAITNPLNKSEAYALLPLYNKAVVTSGNYEKFVTFNNKRYSHIIDPRSGYPASGILSATVFAPSAELADALATSIFVMGVSQGINRVNQLPDVDCIIVEDNGAISTSKHIQINND